MAVDMFIKIGDLKGEAQDQKHKDEIDVISWSWGISNSGSAHIGGVPVQAKRTSRILVLQSGWINLRHPSC